MTMNRRLLTFGLATFLCLVGFAAVEPVASQKMELKPGWNLVTIQFPVVEADLERFLALQPMTLDAVTKSYVRCTSLADLKIGVGYWVFSANGQEIQLTKDQSQTSWETATLKSGWNLLGVADNSAWQSQAAQVWQWLNGHFQKISKTALTSGEGYWAAPNQ